MAKNKQESLATGTGKAPSTVPEQLSCCWCLGPFFQHPEMLSGAAVPWSEQICMTEYCLFDPQTAALEKEGLSTYGQSTLSCSTKNKMINLHIKQVKIMPLQELH